MAVAPASLGPPSIQYLPVNITQTSTYLTIYQISGDPDPL